MTGERAELKALCHQWLPDGIADRFLGLCRPATRLFTAGPDDPPVGQLGGQPMLPADMA